MNTQDYFVPARLLNYMKIDIFTKSRLWLIGAAVFGGMSLLISGFTALGGNTGNFHFYYYGVFLFLGGLYTTSRAYSEMHLGEASYSYISLPASTLEKTIGKVLIYGLGYALFVTVFYTGVSIFSEFLNGIFFSRTHPVFKPFGYNFWLMLSIFIVFQTIFLMGSAWFKSFSFIKTLLFLILLSFLTFIVVIVAFKLIFWSFFDGWNLNRGLDSLLINLQKGGTIQKMVDAKRNIESFDEVFKYIWKVFMWGLLPLGGIASVYFKLKETEV
ncbi:MAG: hypothetical protein JXR95_10440 [Deltaproteobacteria bacterium]|nr:hypothetical protein [Deltaproteobacteria bacterium]